jgi:amino acid transporter
MFFSRIVNAEGGGFLPFGLGGVISGASAAFFAFNGFDSICISAEEAKDPVKSVPRAILIELVIVLVVYCGSAVGTVRILIHQ